MIHTDKLVLSNLIFHARHGVLQIERRRAQEFRVTVELEFSLARAGRSDDLGATIDYRAVQAVVGEVVEGSHRKLIEALAEEIAQRLLGEFTLARSVTVEVLKPRPPVDFKFAGVTVRISRQRNARSRRAR
jgi:dihydroneopterin aldolase